MEQEKPSYYAIIPATVRYDDRLKANEKLLYGEITCLSESKGHCFAGNQYFADLYKVSKENISRWVSNLVDCGYIKRTIIYKDGTKEVSGRYLTLIHNPIDEKINTLLTKRSIPSLQKDQYPIDEKIKDNTTSINTINIIDKQRNQVALSDFEQVNNFTNEEIESIEKWIEFRVKQYKCKKTTQALTVLLNHLVIAKQSGYDIPKMITYFMEYTTYQNINATNIMLALKNKLEGEKNAN